MFDEKLNSAIERFLTSIIYHSMLEAKINRITMLELAARNAFVELYNHKHGNIIKNLLNSEDLEHVQTLQKACIKLDKTGII